MTVYRAGNFAVPGSTGNLTVQLLDDTLANDTVSVPHTVVFFGANQATEDSVLTPSVPAVFYGMMARQAGGSWISRANAFRHATGYTTRGDRCMFSIVDASINPEYEATPVSSAAGTFTVNFSTVAASRYVNYLAVCESTGYDAVNNDVHAGTGSSTTSEAFQALSAFTLGGYAYDGGGVNYVNTGAISVFQGGSSYPASYTFGNGDASSLSISQFGGQQFTRLYNFVNQTSPVVAVGATFSGPFLGDFNHTAYPSDATHFFSSVAGFGDSGVFSAWTGDSETGAGTPSGSVSGTSYQAMSRQSLPGVVLTFGANGTETGAAVSSSNKAAFFGVWTPSYEGCVGITDGGYLYQSRSKSWLSALNGSGVVTGTIETDTPGFDYVTAIAGTTSQDLVWWGAASDAPAGAFLGQIYRRILN